MFKPEFFDVLSKGKDAWDAVGDVRYWLRSENGQVTNPFPLLCERVALTGANFQEDTSSRLGCWSKLSIALELGGVLKARERASAAPGAPERPPGTHRAFSSLPWDKLGSSGGELLGEGDIGGNLSEEDLELGNESGRREREVADGGWLENDDIEDFDSW